MKKKQILSRILCMVLVLTTLFSISATTIYAVSEAKTTEVDNIGENTQNTAGEFEKITIDKNNFTNGFDNEPGEPLDDYVENELVGDVITTPDGFRIRMNSNLESYTIVEYVGISKVIDIPQYHNNLPITRIDDSVFYGNQRITNVTLHDNIVFVGERAFDNCPLLISNSTKDENGGCYLGTKDNPYYYFLAAAEKGNRDDLTSFTVHNDTKIVGSFAFEKCGNLKTVTIGNGVKSIGYAAMMQCNSLEFLTVPFLGENGKNENNAHLGYIFGARTIGGNISYVPTTLKSLTVNGGEKVSFNALYGIDMIESLTLPFLGKSAEIAENAYLSYVFGGKNSEDNLVPQTLKNVKIKGGYIGNNAFANCVYIGNIEIGDGVISIGTSAFYNCDGIESIIIPDNVSNVGASAFEDCNNLSSAIIGNGVKAISNSMFDNCVNLSDIVIGNNVTDIGSYAFYRTRALHSLTIPGHVENIGYWSFSSSAIKNVTIESGVKVIADQAFYYSDLVSVKIGNTVTAIGYLAFAGCSNLCDINIPDSVTSIGFSAFENCSNLVDVTIPSSVTKIGSAIFSGCRILKNIYVSENNEFYKSINGNLYTKNGKILVQYAIGKSDASFVVPEEVTIIENGAFSHSNNLVSITIGKNVKTIRNDAFLNCKNLLEVINKSSLEISQGSIDHGGVAVAAKFVHNGASKIVNVGDYSFISLEGVNYLVGYTGKETKLTLPESYNGAKYEIYKNTFRNNFSITQLTIPDSVTGIGVNAFFDCYNLASVTVGKGVTKIADMAFANCFRLAEVINNSSLDIKKGLSNHGSIAYYALEVHKGNSSIVNYLNDYLFITLDGVNSLVGYLGNATDLTLPESYNGEKYQINRNAFSYNREIVKITIPSNVTSIGDYAFTACFKLNTVTIKSGLTSIGNYVFYACPLLETVTIPNSVTSIGDIFGEFEQNTGIRWNEYDNAYYIGNEYNPYLILSVAKSNLITSCVVNSNTKFICGTAFYNCTNLTSVTVPDGVISIGERAFYNCKALTSVIIPDSVTSLGYDVFAGCTILTVYCEASNKPQGWNTYWNNSKIPVVWGYDIGTRNLSDVLIPSESSARRISYRRHFGNVQPIVMAATITSSEGLSFVSNGDGTCYVKGIGTCTDTDIVIPSIAPSGESVTSIAKNAFYYSTSITSIEIPNSVTSIGNSAFNGCAALKSITIGTGVTSIGSSAFAYCSNLQEVKFNAISVGDLTSTKRVFLEAGTEGDGIKLTIGATVNKIPAYMFYNAYGITKVEFEKNSVCKSIGDRAFSGCESIVSLIVPDSVINISSYAFSRCVNLVSVTMGSGVTTIADNAFYFCDRLVEVINKSSLAITKAASGYGRVAINAIEVHNGESKIVNVDDYLFMYSDGVNYLVSYLGNATEMTLPASYNGKKYEIYAKALSGNTDVIKVYISNGATKIGKNAFENCTSLVSIEFASGVKSIDHYAFTGCSALSGVYISDLEHWCNISFASAQSVPLYYAKNLYLNGQLLTELIIPDTVTSIGANAFSQCTALVKVTMGDAVTSIGANAFSQCTALVNVTIGKAITDIGASAFANCTGLTTINFNATEIKNYSISGNGVFHNAGTSGEGIRFIIGANVIKIPYYLFHSNSSTAIVPKITSVEFEKGSICQSIGGSAFHSCVGIKSIDFPSSLITIETNAFAYCTGLEFVNISKDVSLIGGSAFANCSSLKYINVDAQNTSYKSIDGNLYTKDGKTLMQYACGKEAERFVIPNKVTTILSNAFLDCTNLIYNISDNAYYIGKNDNPYFVLVKAVSSDISSCVINESTRIICGYAFDGCSNLEKITIPEGVISIGTSAFRACANLTEINFNAVAMDDLSSEGVFYNSGTNGEGIKVTVGVGVTKIPARLFWNATKVISVEFDDRCTCESIGDYAFNGCDALTGIIVLDSVSFIGKYAFDCNNLTIYLEATAEPTNSDYQWNYANRPVVFGYNNITTNSDFDYVIHGGNARITRYKGVNTHVVIPAVIDGHPVVSVNETFCRNSSIVSLVIPSGIAKIGACAFLNCKSLVRVEFQEGSICNQIGSKAFGNCSALSTIVYSGEENEWRHIRKASDWKYGSLCTVNYTKKSSGLLYDTNDDITEFWVSGYINTDENDTVIIPELYSGRPVSKIYENTFNGKENIVSITIPSSVKEIGENALKNCINLVEFHLRADIKAMAFGVLEGCVKLESVTLPFLGKDGNTDKTDYIGYTFGANSYKEHRTKVPAALKTIVILGGTDVFENAFSSCTYIEVIKIPSTTKTIGDQAFANCVSLRLMISEGENGYDSLNTFAIPDSVTAVGREILIGCSLIRNIYIGSSLSLIEDYVFENPLFGIDKSSSRLLGYTVSLENEHFVSDEYGSLYRYIKVGYEKIKVAVMDVPAMANLIGYEMPEHIVEIAPYAFAYNSTLRAIELNHVRRIAKSAFYSASELIYAVFNPSLAEEYEKEYSDYVKMSCESSLDVLNEYLYEEYERTNAAIPQDKWPPFVPLTENNVKDQYYSCIGDRAFMGCLSLQKIDIYADNILGIGDYAFADCPSLASVNIGKNLEKLGFSAFGTTASGESNIQAFSVDNANKYFKSIDGVLYSVNDNGTLTLEIYPAALVLYDKYNGNKKAFTLPTNVEITAIQTYAFQGVKTQMDVIIRPKSKLVVGDYAFANSRILSVTIGENVTSLGLIRGEGEYTVFADMEYLTSINVDAGNEYYSSENGVLFDKSKAKLIKYPSDRVGDVYEVPSSVKVIASMAFKRADNIKQVLISSTVSAIGLEAFYACGNLLLIYFDDVYAPVSVMENAFTTFVEIEEGISYNPMTQIGYSDNYYSNGANGEYGWVNYSGTYNLAVYDRLPELERGNSGEGYYAVVVVDSNGVRLGNIQVSLTDSNGKTETITTGYGNDGIGVATFYDLFGMEGLGFSLDFSLPYSMTVSDPLGKYRGYVNPSIYLDEDMRITYITLTIQPVAFGVSCGETEINTETADINKAQYDYPCVSSEAHSHDEDGLVCENGIIRERAEISVIAYCDTSRGYYFVDKNGKWITSNGLYQNDVKICDPSRAEVYDGYVIFYFEPIINNLAEEVDIEVRLTAESSVYANEPMSCKTVLNIHIFNFVVTKEDINLEAEDINVDIGAGGDMLATLMETKDFKVSIGKDMDFGIDIDGDTVTLEIKGSKTDKASFSSYEEGYFEYSKAHNKNTYFFTHSGKVKDKENKEHNLKYNIRFARDHQTDNYYYYQCRVMENGKEVDRFHGAVNGWDLSAFTGKQTRGTRSAVATQAYLIYKTHFETAKEQKKISGLGADAIYAESIKAAPSQGELSYNFKVGFSGNLVFKYDEEKGLYPVSSTVKGEIALTFDCTAQFMVWIIPVIIEIDIDVNGNVTLDFKFDEQRKVQFDDLTLKLDINLDAYGGIGSKGFTGGFYGVVGTVFVFEIAPSFGVESWEISADVGARVKALWWTKTFSFWNGKYYIVPPKSEAVASALLPGEEALAAAYLVDTYSLARAEDLESGFKLLVVGDYLYKLSTVDMSTEYGYDEYNYAKLAISRWNGYGWDEDILLDGESKTNDASYMIYEDAETGNAYIVFTQQTKHLINDDSYAGASDLSIKIVEIGENGRISVAQEINQRDNYIYLQQYTVINGVPTVVWAENSDNNMLGVSPHNYYSEETNEYHVFETKANSIWMCQYNTDENAWNEPILIKSGLPPITDLALNNDGYISFVSDTNSDLSDSSDRVMMHGAINGEFNAINDTRIGSITSIEIIDGKLVYYYDALASDGVDSWKYLEKQNNSHMLPSNIPAEFVPVYNGNNDIVAILFHEAKTWSEGEVKVSGSAIYGMFFENGVWGDKVEISAYIPVADYYITEFDAEFSSQNIILLYVSVINSKTDRVVIDSYLYDMEAMLNIVKYTVDYANSYVSVTLKNVGAVSTPVYISLNNDEYILLDEFLSSGEKNTYTVLLSGSETLEYALKIAEDEFGKDNLETEIINLNYSDLEIFGKQMLLGENNTLLIAIKNTGSIENTATTVIRIGNFADGNIINSAITSAIAALSLKEGECVMITVKQEDGSVEQMWVLKDTVTPGEINYHEINLGEYIEIADKGLISMAIIPSEEKMEKGIANKNNYGYVSYADLIGVLESGESVDVKPELIESIVAADKTKDDDIILNYTAGQSDFVTGVQIDGLYIGNYNVTTETIGGVITIDGADIKLLQAGEHMIEVSFSDGTVQKVKLNIADYHTVIWMDGDREIGKTTVIEGTIPSLGYKPTKEADNQYEYTFIGWSSVKGSENIGMMQSAFEDTVYYAVWRKTERKYTVTWVLTQENGNSVRISEKYNYNDIPSYRGTLFAPDNQIFDGWNNAVVAVKTDVTYIAVYRTFGVSYDIGDINGDGTVNTRDLAILKQYVVGQIVLTEEQILRCNVFEDYNSDGSAKINTRDIALLQQYIVGIVGTQT